VRGWRAEEGEDNRSKRGVCRLIGRGLGGGGMRWSEWEGG